MTTDITELAQSLKAAAEKATPGPWYVHDKPCEDGNYGIDTSDKEFLAEAVVWWGFARQSIWREEDAKYIALANPANILALVEALEKAQRYIEELREWNAGLAQESFERQQLISELEPIRAAAEKLVRCKGRYHSEQNYRALAALFGVNTPDLPPLDGESHAVTVENLQESAYRAGLTAGWNLGLTNNNDGFNKCLAAHAAGIKVEVE
ncbi:ead/Ea22-like family protein [Klebsiella pneumoniae]|uniref:ead/Ea22-like family protein n=1 Tax=Klebsiella pneumoniae TaxID=573 RepID=UPI0022B5BADE|nr:ead/Ea22-like family protein [Klebsiella pneumoniae]MCZ5053776.1 ead/Ea22-like family protein [Klebsiella pneumoniae]